VIPGEEIRRGEILGFSGASGKVTSPHLHFEVRVGGTPVNPYKYLQNSSMLQQVQPDLPF
jgi:murein DD-endopeptidase MepM/ murein hydrolase activator NlpD